jgi:outer membrane biosynthesis protein TonB
LEIDLSMGRGAFLSGAFHVVVVLLLYLGLPAWFAPEEFQQPIPVELATLAEITTPPKSEAPAPEPAPAAKPEPPPPEAAPPPPPEPPAPEPIPEIAELPAPAEAVPEPEPEPAPEPEEAEPEPEPVPDVLPAQKPKPPEPEETEQAEEPAEQDPLASLLKNVEKLKDQPESTETALNQPASPAAQPPQNLSDQPLTMSEIDAIRQQISRCWNIPAGARDAENLVVEIRAMFNPDGSVARAEILDTGRMASDPFYRAAAESAYRAVLQCSPLQMPPKKYNVWKIVTLRFNPKEMLGT